MFVDNARIKVKAGNGGNGCYSFYRDKYMRNPIADGGDGGRGGDVIIRADRNILTLYDFKYNQHFFAPAGGNASSNNKKGRNAECKIVLVPKGTVVLDAATNLRLRELLEDKDGFVAVKGGAGGKGSLHAKEEEQLKGNPGEARDLVLDLRLIADVGLVGFPNSGKSTLISKISNAQPKIANYPFTTKDPVLGIVDREEESFSVADIPGLIKDSHLGRGLGDRFLRHVERTKLLIQMIDMSAEEGRDPAEDYRVINNELKFYSRQVYNKPRILAANKMDRPMARENLDKFKKQIKKKIIPISAIESQGLEELIDAAKKKLFPRSS